MNTRKRWAGTLLYIGIAVLLLGGLLLWIFWDEAVYPVKTWAARREWQSLSQKLPETGTLIFVTGEDGAEYRLPAADLLETAEFSRVYPPGQSPGSPDWKLFVTDESGKKITLQNVGGTCVEVFADNWFEIECPELVDAVTAIKRQQEGTI